MSERFKILGQLDGTSSEVELYTVPNPEDQLPLPTGTLRAGLVPRQTLVTSLIVCNTHASAAKTFYIRLKSDFEAGDDPKELIFSDAPISSSNTLVLSLGLTLSSKARIKAKGADISFTLMGIEVL